MELFLNGLRFIAALGLSLILFGWAWFLALMRLEDRRRKRAEFWIEIISAGRLRAEDDDWAAVYHEREKWTFFYGKVIQNGRGFLNVLYVPSEQQWARSVPEWMANKREIVLGLLKQELKPRKYRIYRIEETEA